MQQLQFRDLVQLDTATMAQVPAIRERRLQMQYGGRWLQLTHRLPHAKHSQQSGKVALDYQQLWQRLQQSSKHSLLQTLVKQIRNVNDVAALIVAWLQTPGNWWELVDVQLGDTMDLDPFYVEAALYPNYQLSQSGLRQLQDKVVSALSTGFVGCLDFFRDMQHPDYKAALPEFAAFGALDLGFEKATNHQLLSAHR